MQYVSDVMSRWPSLPEFCADIGVEVALARVWKHRRFIPAERWAAIEAAAQRRNIAGATASDMARLLAAAKQSASAA